MMTESKTKKRDRKPTNWRAVTIVGRTDDVIAYERPERDKHGLHGGNIAELIPFARAASQLAVPEAYLADLANPEAYLADLILRGIIRSVMVPEADGSTRHWVPIDDLDDYLHPERVDRA